MDAYCIYLYVSVPIVYFALINKSFKTGRELVAMHRGWLLHRSAFVDD